MVLCLTVAHNLPKLINLMLCEKLIILVVFMSCYFEWLVACSHSEEYYSKSEQINLNALVLFLLNNFWSHVQQRTNIRSHVAITLGTGQRCTEPEINYF